MRWTHHPPSPEEHRIIRQFLFLPKRIGNETRWLEWAKINQCYSSYTGYDGEVLHRWSDYGWVERESISTT